MSSPNPHELEISSWMNKRFPTIVQSVLEAVNRRSTVPRYLPGSVKVSSSGKIVQVVIDHPTQMAPIFPENLTGSAMVAGDRVMVMFTTEGAYVLGKFVITDTRLASCTLKHATTDTVVGTTSGVLVDVDATNLVVTFTAPPSGKVKVIWTGGLPLSTGASNMVWAIREGTTTVTGSQIFATHQNLPGPGYGETVVSGLTPGQSYTWKWAWGMTGGGVTGNMYHGPAYGEMRMEIWAER
jgi:hypothetical protein